MEEKLLALEGLGAFKGFLSLKKWNVHSRKKSYTTDTQIKSFQTNASNVIELQGDTVMISQNTEREKECKAFIIGDDEREVSLKSCDEMDITRSDTDIPGCDKMNADCDKIFSKSNEKINEPNKTKSEHVTSTKATLIKENSFDGTSEEVGSSESEEVSHEISKKKAPSAVQDWVNHLPSKGSTCSKENSDCKEVKEENQGAFVGEENSLVRAELSREASLQSSSSLDSILDSRRPDPVEIFLNLGFGGLPGIDTENCRIPKRFLVPSKCKGGDWNEFLRRELIQAQNFECSSLGFRGLSGPSYRRPSAIVANIMEKLRERAVSQPPRSRFSTIAKMVLDEKSVLNKLTPEFQSVLSPDNRKFLQNQGQKSPEVPRRRIIFGQKSFAFAHDGEFVEVDFSNGEKKATKDCPNTLSPKDGGDDPPSFPNAELLLKLRRSSLQKQKNVEEDTDVDDVFYVVGKEEPPPSEPPYNGNECTKKAGKIPRRFLSSTNLIALEENSLSETMRLEVEKEIMSLSQKIKSISNQDLPSVLQQVKELRSKIENGGQEPSEM